MQYACSVSVVVLSGCAVVPRRVLRGFDPIAFKSLREERGHTIGELARLSDVAKPTLYAYERGTRQPQVDVLARVIDALQAPMSAVMKVDPDDRHPGDWRVLTGKTQPQLAQSVGLSTSLVRDIEAGEASLTPNSASRLAAGVGITVDEYVKSYERCKNRPAGTPP